MVTEKDLRHLLNRTSFGIGPKDLQQLKSMGINAYLKKQLSPETITESELLTEELNKLKTLQMTPVELLRNYGPKGQKKETKKEVVDQALQAYLLQGIYSRRQLQAVMIDFWLNHFNIYVRKELTGIWVGAYTQQAIAPYSLGKFRDLLGSTAKHPAMLFYLDNWLNTAPNSPGARGRFKGINENYARELMELHTLGVNGGYTQQDVISLARILTGWGLATPEATGDGSGFYFNAKRHDWDSKTFLGVNIPAKGEEEVEQALDILASHPATAQHISYKLTQYFVADEPPLPLVENLIQRFLDTDGDIRALLETIFSSSVFWDEKYFNNQFKTPYQYVISLVRLSEKPNLRRVIAFLKQLGMVPYDCATPDGYDYTQDTWLNPDALLQRINLATTLASNFSVDHTEIPVVLGYSLSEHTQQVIAANPPNLIIPIILGSPEMMYR